MHLARWDGWCHKSKLLGLRSRTSTFLVYTTRRRCEVVFELGEQPRKSCQEVREKLVFFFVVYFELTVFRVSYLGVLPRLLDHHLQTHLHPLAILGFLCRIIPTPPLLLACLLALVCTTPVLPRF